jgi:hypothetical protein
LLSMAPSTSIIAIIDSLSFLQLRAFNQRPGRLLKNSI